MRKIKEIKKKRFLLGIGIAIGIFVVIGIGYFRWFYESPWESFSSVGINPEEIHLEFGSTLEEVAIVFSPNTGFHMRDFVAPDGIISVLEEGDMKQYSTRFYNPNVHRFKMARIELYNVVTGEKMDSYDILEIFQELEPYLEGYQLGRRYDPQFLLGEVIYESTYGERYVVWRLENIPTGPHTPRETKYLVISMETREAFVYRDIPEHLYPGVGRDFVAIAENVAKQHELERQLRIFRSWDAGEDRVHHFLLNNGINTGQTGSYFSVWPREEIYGQVEIRLCATRLPRDNPELYERFPRLKEFAGQRDLRVIIILAGYPTAEDILSMFMEDSREISFENAYLREDWSISGERQRIESFEDFFEWLDWEEEEVGR